MNVEESGEDRSMESALLKKLREAGLPPEMATGPPEAITGYSDLTEVARGGQGVVYRATQDSTRRVVAIKLLFDAPGASPERTRRFEREVEIAAGLRHPNIVTVFDSGTTASGRPYVVMDFVEGLALDEHIETNSLSQRATLALFINVCDTVNFAHRRGVLHRDLKPGNLMVDVEGAHRLLDFGLARRLETLGPSTLTATGLIGGTIAYMAPEQARGEHEEVDIRSDVYSLGAILYRLLAGRPPHEVSGDLYGALRRVAEERPTPIGEAATVPVAADLRTIVHRALAPDRDRRYQTAGELARDVECYLNGDPIDAKRDSAWYVLHMAIRRHRAWVVAGILFMALLVGSALALGVLYAGQLRTSRLANERFADVRALANGFITDIDPLLRDLPGTSSQRLRLVERSAAYLDRLAATAGGDPDLLAEVATGYVMIGRALSDRGQSNTGDPASSIEHFHTAQSIYEELVGRYPQRPEFAVGLAGARLGVCRAFEALGDWESASVEVEEALAIVRRVQEEHPGYDARESLSEILGWAGRMDRQSLRLDRAAVRHQEANAIADALATEHPDDYETRRDAAVGRFEMGMVERSREDHEAALPYFERYREETRALSAEFPQGIATVRDYAVACQWVGRTWMALDEPALAIPPLLEVIRTVEEFPGATREPGLLMNAAYSASMIGEIRLSLGAHEEALQSFAKSMGITERAVEAAPDDPRFVRQLGVDRYKMSEYHRERARDSALAAGERRRHAQEAARWLERSLEVFVNMRDRQILGPGDQVVPEELEGEINAWNAEAARI